MSQPYGQQQYQSRPYGGPPATPTASRSAGLNVVSAVLVAIGVIGVLLAYTVLDWFRSDKRSFFSGAKGNSTFSELHKSLSHTKAGLSAAEAKHISLGVSDLYFGWLGWVLLATVAVLGALAIAPTLAAAPVLKLLAVLAALAAIGLTAWAIDLVRVTGSATGDLGTAAPSYTDYLKHTSFGAWAAVAGFLVVAIGAVLPARRR